ncbi:1-acyl-sn-glycerol-3-phosphate acyltransferase [Flavobacteriaceae bacterium F08102]|nr:1-acyl-sn-glycerol-3-phosphate acyltransferase [Flavobacteriaceae bacterium F08102]
MKKIIGTLVLWITGWKAEYPAENFVLKTVMLAAPHTSNWDLLYALAVYWKKGIKARFLIKNNYTKGIHGYFFRWLGAIGVNREKNTNMVDFAVNLFNTSDTLVLMVPPEGTRKRVDQWKTGFYHIAIHAKVPVSLGFLDYKKKIAGVGGVIYLSGNFNHDMKIIEDFYKTKTGKYPANYNPKIY